MTIPLTYPYAFGLFGYGTAILTYGIHLATGFPKAKNDEEAKRIRAALAANGVAFGSVAQFTSALILFFLYPGNIVQATTFGAFGVLWLGIFLNDYFNRDPRPLAFLDIAFAIYTAFAGVWFFLEGTPVFTALLWSITVLVIILIWTHGYSKYARVAGIVGIENALLSYYLMIGVVFNVQFGAAIPLLIHIL